MSYNASMGRQPSSKHRITGDSLEEIKRGLDMESVRLTEGENIRVRAYQLSTGPLLNVLSCWYMEQPKEERERIAREGAREYERRLGSDSPISFRAIADCLAALTRMSTATPSAGPAENLDPKTGAPPSTAGRPKGKKAR